MIFDIHAEVYTDLRESAGLTQRQLAEATQLSRSTVQRIEAGRRLPSREQELRLLEATACSRRYLAELLCKTLSERIGVRLAIVEAGDDLTTPQCEAYGLLASCQRRLPTDLWWSWKERLGRVRTQSLILEQEGYAIARDIRAQLQALAEGDTTAER